MRKIFIATLFAIALPAAAQNTMSVDWGWKKDHRCNNTSPELSISGIPEGTKTLTAQMNDLDFQNKDHGGGSIAHGGGSTFTVPEGALQTNYRGPCPSNFSSFGHSYQFTIRALGADGAEIGKAVKAKDFSASTAK